MSQPTEPVVPDVEDRTDLDDLIGEEVEVTDHDLDPEQFEDDD